MLLAVIASVDERHAFFAEIVGSSAPQFRDATSRITASSRLARCLAAVSPPAGWPFLRAFAYSFVTTGCCILARLRSRLPKRSDHTTYWAPVAACRLQVSTRTLTGPGATGDTIDYVCIARNWVRVAIEATESSGSGEACPLYWGTPFGEQNLSFSTQVASSCTLEGLTGLIIEYFHPADWKPDC